MNSISNHFTKTVEPTNKPGQFTISSGTLSPVQNNYIAGQWVRLRGPVMASGVYRVVTLEDGQLTLDGLPDGLTEDFSGYVYGLAPPPDFLALVEEIAAFQTEASKERSDVISESFGGYAYSKATGKKGGAITWQEQFGDKLNVWRRMYDNPAAEIRENNR